MKLLILILLMTNFVSAINADFNCPESVGVNEEFVCSLYVSDGEGIYDVKVYIRGDDGMINRIWVDDDWQRTDWYAKSLISNGETINVKLKIDKEFFGSANGEFKLRQNGQTKAVYDESFSITINSERGDVEETNIKETNIEKIEVVVENAEEVILPVSENVVVVEKETEMILLNDEKVEDEELTYISKNAKVVDYLVYAFAIFLIIIIGFLISERF